MNDVPATVRFHDLRPAAQSFRQAVAEGLGKARKTLPSVFFYDDAGSELFQRITRLEEYYPTRTELALLRTCAGDIAALMGPGRQIIEFGCGSSSKVRALLDAVVEPSAYVAIDISKSALMALAGELAGAYPGLEIIALCADYCAPLTLNEVAGDKVAGKEVAGIQGARKTGFFPGSNIGNFTPRGASDFLRAAAGILGPDGGFIVGIDLKKDSRILEAAYNDAQGVTALFNLNLLERINRDLGGDIDVGLFRHKAFYNSSEGRIEMHLESLANHTATIDGKGYEFVIGETIHTENSYKYSIAEFRDLASRSGFEPVAVWTDADDLFSIHYLTVR